MFMRKRTRLVSLFLLSLFALTACYVYPDSGNWHGVGSYNDEASADHRSCSYDLKISHVSDSLNVESFVADCGYFSARLSPGLYERRGDQIWKDDHMVGHLYADGTVEIEASGANIFNRYPIPNDRVVLTWTLMGEDLHFSLREQDGPRSRRFDGWLHRES